MEIAVQASWVSRGRQQSIPLNARLRATTRDECIGDARRRLDVAHWPGFGQLVPGSAAVVRGPQLRPEHPPVVQVCEPHLGNRRAVARVAWQSRYVGERVLRRSSSPTRSRSQTATPSPAHGTWPSTKPVCADTNVTDIGENPAGTGPPRGRRRYFRRSGSRLAAGAVEVGWLVGP